MLKGVLFLIPTNRLHLFALPVASMPGRNLPRCSRHLPSTFGDLWPAHRHQLPASPAGGPDHFLHFRSRDWGRRKPWPTYPNENEVDPTHGASGRDANLLDCSGPAISMGRSAHNAGHYLCHRGSIVDLAARTGVGRRLIYEPVRRTISLPARLRLAQMIGRSIRPL